MDSRVGLPGLGLAVLLAAPGAVAAMLPGAEIESVRPGRAAAAAGLEPGDRLLSWRLEEPAAKKSSGSFASWLDLHEVEVFQAIYGPVVVRGRRGGEDREWTLPSGRWGVRGRPALDDPLAARVARATAGLEGVDAPAARAALLAVADAATEAPVRAYLLSIVAAVLGSEGRWKEAAETYERAAAEVAAPQAAQLLEQAGSAWRARADFDRALAVLGRALAMRERQADGELGIAWVLNTMGNIEVQREDPLAAERHYARSHEIRARLAPSSYQVASSLNNLGTVAGIRNDLSNAERRFLAALQIDEQRGLADPTRYGNLGIVARLRGDLERAESYELRALELERAAGPDNPGIAEELLNLGNIRSDRGDYAGAIAALEEALGRFTAISPDHSKISLARLNLGEAHRRAGDPVAARGELERALALRRATAPGSLEEASALHSLGRLELSSRDLDRARLLLDAALAIRDELAPASGLLAGLLIDLARLEVAAGDPTRAERRYREAIDAIEAQQLRLGGGDRGLAAFRDKYSDAYRELLDLLARENRSPEAFELLERSRAQALRALLRGRDLDPIERRQSAVAGDLRRLESELAHAFEDLSALSTGEADAPARRALRARIEELHRRRDELGRRGVESSQQRDVIDVPDPLPLARLRDALEPGVLVLSYSLGSESSWLFTLTRDRGPDAIRIDRGEAELRAMIASFRDLASRRVGSRGRAELERLAAELGGALLGPAAEALRAARSLLVLPDGPLHALPFAALRLADGRGAVRWLVEIAPVHVAVSLSVLAEEAGGARPHGDPSFVAFADPSPGSSAPDSLRSRLGPIPRTRDEVASIARQYGERARLFVDREATEENARAAAPSADYLHFAVHAIVDTEQPLDSALVLAPARPGAAPELLQAWEILESLRLHARLVTLSACESGLGRVLAGEGVLGLTRAFHAAGARSVLVSLWAVDDQATSELMRRTYAGLRRGLAADEALRAAQLELLRAPLELSDGSRTVALDASSPFYWAPFLLSGGGR